MGIECGILVFGIIDFRKMDYEIEVQKFLMVTLQGAGTLGLPLSAYKIFFFSIYSTIGLGLELHVNF